MTKKEAQLSYRTATKRVYRPQVFIHDGVVYMIPRLYRIDIKGEEKVQSFAGFTPRIVWNGWIRVSDTQDVKRKRKEKR